MTEVDMINGHLKSFGLNPFGFPLYRIVWSDFMTEKRKGVFRVHVGNLFLREEVGIKEVPKYGYIFERWILERWFSGEFTFTPELPESINGSYEPIYTFQDKFGNYLAPNLKVAEILVKRAEYRKDNPVEEIAQDELEAKEIENYMDALEVSPITNALHMGEAVGYRESLSTPSPENQAFRKRLKEDKRKVN